MFVCKFFIIDHTLMCVAAFYLYCKSLTKLASPRIQDTAMVAQLPLNPQSNFVWSLQEVIQTSESLNEKKID